MTETCELCGTTEDVVGRRCGPCTAELNRDWYDRGAPVAGHNGKATTAHALAVAPGEVDAEFDRDVSWAVRKRRVDEAAKAVIAAEDHAKTWREPPGNSLTDFLGEADTDVRWRVEGLLAEGANATLTAQFKAGKSTTMANLVRALADGVPFLGRFTTTPARVAVWDYELPARTLRGWLRRLGINNTGNVHVLTWRGYRIDLTTPAGEDWAVNWLRDNRIDVWILDPYGRALAGADENDNTAVGRFLEALDVIKNRAGVGELVLPAHTGRKEHATGAEHARGATRLDDWVDARWVLTRVGDDRFFRADGRDVDVDEGRLVFDDATGELTLTDDSRHAVKAAKVAVEGMAGIVGVVRDNPGIASDPLRAAARVPREFYAAAYAAATAPGGPVETRYEGRAKRHYLSDPTNSANSANSAMAEIGDVRRSPIKAADIVRATESKSAGGEELAELVSRGPRTHLCTQCQSQPRFGAAPLCRDCLTANGDQDSWRNAS